MMCPIEDVTAQSYDLQFGTNVLGMQPYQFHLRLPLILVQPQVIGTSRIFLYQLCWQAKNLARTKRSG